MTGAVAVNAQGRPIKGRPVELGGTTYLVPPMNAGTFEDFEERILALQAGGEARPVPLVVDLLHRCLLRNYPEFTREMVRDHVDLDNWTELFAMIMGDSGYRQWAEQEAAAGNARAAQILASMQSPGAGSPSTPTAPPPSAGPSTTAEST